MRTAYEMEAAAKMWGFVNDCLPQFCAIEAMLLPQENVLTCAVAGASSVHSEGKKTDFGGENAIAVTDAAVIFSDLRFPIADGLDIGYSKLLFGKGFIYITTASSKVVCAISGDIAEAVGKSLIDAVNSVAKN